MDPFRGSDAEWINHEPIPKECYQSFKNLILSCWTLNPEERPSVKVTINQLEEMTKDPEMMILPLTQSILSLCDKLNNLIQQILYECLQYIEPCVTEHRLVVSIDTGKNSNR